MTDLTDLKIPVFPGINDAPIEPTANEGQNISYSNERYNALVEELAAIFEKLNARISVLEESNSSGNATGSGDAGGGNATGSGTTDGGNNQGPQTISFDATIPTGDGFIDLGSIPSGFLSDWAIEGMTLDDSIEFGLNPGYKPNYAEPPAEESNGVRFYAASPTEEVYEGDNAFLIYSDIASEKQVRLVINYQ